MVKGSHWSNWINSLACLLIRKWRGVRRKFLEIRVSEKVASSEIEADPNCLVILTN